MSPISKYAMELAVSEMTGERGGKRYRCVDCGLGNFVRKEVQLDHRDPVVPLGTSAEEMSWDEIIDRMFKCPVDNLQCLCKECHTKKTNEERKDRNMAKKVKEVMKNLPSFITADQAEDLVKMIPEDLKISGENLGILVKTAIRWYISLEKK